MCPTIAKAGGRGGVVQLSGETGWRDGLTETSSVQQKEWQDLPPGEE